MMLKAWTTLEVDYRLGLKPVQLLILLITGNETRCSKIVHYWVDHKKAM
jgi:hypothetical protein